MGFSLTWLAIKDISRDAALAALQLRGTGRFEEFAESEITAAALPNDWYLIVYQRANPETFPGKDILAGITANTEAIICFVEEHVMVSHAACWRNGQQIWSITHDVHVDGIKHLEIDGALPPNFTAIRERLFAEQRARAAEDPKVDCIFDIPVEVAEQLTTYRHDRDIPGLTGNVFEILEPLNPPKPSFFKKLFRG
jgi:hypothetical protein